MGERTGRVRKGKRRVSGRDDFRMHRRWLRLLAVGVAAAMVSVAASAQELAVGLGANITSLDPLFHNFTPNNSIATHLFDRLVHRDERQRLIPGLATAWKAVDDTTWEFSLRRGVKFHDGSEFTAEDVAATLKRVTSIPNSPSSFGLYVRSIVGTEILDPYTIRIKTAKVQPSLPLDLSTINIIPRKYGAASTSDFNTGRAVIGTGPFRFVEYMPGERLVLARNDDYWGPKPAWTKVTFLMIASSSARVAALAAGDVQLIEQIPAADLVRLQSDANVTLAQTVGSRLIYLALDSYRDQSPYTTDKAGAVLPNNPLKDPRVRKALSKAINRQVLTDRVMGRFATGAGGFLADGFFGASAKLKPEPFDPEGARRLLTEAGYPNGFGLTIHGPNDRYVNDEKVLQTIGPMFARVGVDTRVVTQPWTTFIAQASAPNYAYSVMLVGWGSETGEASSPLRGLVATVNHEAGFGDSNRGRYSNPKVDALLQQALAAVEDARREALLQEASEMAMADVALVPLYFTVNVWAMRKGYVYSPRSDEYTLAQFVKPANGAAPP
jgi:peptide/nickel transport system substrate-binding protein